MSRTQIKQEVHANLIGFYQRFGEAVRLRSRFRIHKAHDFLSRMQELLIRADSWESRKRKQ